MQRGLTLEVDLQALRSNLRFVKQRTGVPVIGVVKANAYGHGMVEVSRVLEQEGIHALAVAYTSEAVALREAGLKAPIIVFFDNEPTEDILTYDLVPVINSIEQARALALLAQKASTTIPCHLNVDTGMGRVGIWHDDFSEAFREISSLGPLRITGLMSHFSEAEDPQSEFTKLQIHRFQRVCQMVKTVFPDCLCHMANSAGVVNFPEACFDAVRVGLILYGGHIPEGSSVKPVMHIKVPIIEIRTLPPGSPVSYGRTFITSRQTTVGVIPAGYAEGLFRSLSNRAYFLYKGQRVPVIGRICMDLTIVDLTDIDQPREGENITILGDGLTAEKLADAAGTISYEILTSFGSSANTIKFTGTEDQ